MWSSRSPELVPWMAETGNGSPSPSSYSGAETTASRFGLSALLATRITGVFERRMISATSWSPAVTPVCTSTTNRIRSASASAMRACSVICLPMVPSASMSMPPVSISCITTPFHSSSISLRSRVTPGSWCTTVSRRPSRRFTSVDLPTFG